MTRLLIGGYSGDKGQGSMASPCWTTTRSRPSSRPTRRPGSPDIPTCPCSTPSPRPTTGTCTPGRSPTACQTSRSARGATGGAEPAHLAVDASGRYLITANYSGGSISVHRLGQDGSIGHAHRPGPARGARRAPAPGAGASAYGALHRTTTCSSPTSAATRSTATGSRQTGSCTLDGVISAPAGVRPAARAARRRRAVTSPPS